MLTKLLTVFLFTFGLTIFVAPIVIYCSKKFKASQTILHYVKEHQAKQGTPTMGGFIFVIPIVVAALLFGYADNFLLQFSLIIMVAFCVLGFMDDFIKIKYKQNEGLKPYQKVVSQFGIALIIALFCYFSPQVGTTLLLPFSMSYIDIGVWIIPFIIVFFVAVTNSVNLIDGLDGLAGGVSLAFLFGLAALMIAAHPLVSTLALSNMVLLMIIGGAALLGYLCWNVFPAKIFMGDTGSLALGGLIACICTFSKMQLFLPIIGIMYVLTALSDVIQVLYYKRTKKRVFLMAPLHHHFQKKGINENKISFIYFVITLTVAGGLLLLCI